MGGVAYNDGLGQTLVEQVAGIIPRYSMLCAGDRVGVAVSGGADSVALLHILHRLRSAFACELTVLHVNHHLRGNESDEDEQFVRKLAHELGLEIAVCQATAPENGIEQAAREQRRAFFRQAKLERNLQRIALAHTRSDQAETVLFRFLRGTGTTGIAGMRPVSKENLIRPLLFTSREAVRDWLRSEKLAWREDSSNQDFSYTRNRIRLETLPDLAKTFNPNLEAVLAGAADTAQGEEDYWDQQLAVLYPRFAQRTHLGLNFHVAELAAQPTAVQRRLIRHALAEIRGDLKGIERDHIESIVALCENMEGHDRIIVPGADSLRSFGNLLITPVGTLAAAERNYQIELHPGKTLELPHHAGTVETNWLYPDSLDQFCVTFKEEEKEGADVCDFDGDLLAPGGTLPSLWVRNWQPGDGLQRVGHHSVEKIKTLFQEHKVLLWERKHWPVLVAGEEIIWARRFGGAARVSASAASRKILRLRFRRP